MEPLILLQAAGEVANEAAQAAEGGFFTPNSTFFHICGLVASIGLILGYVPQAFTTIRTRNTDGISLPGFIMMALGCTAFILQGLMLGVFDADGNFPGQGAALFCTNSVTAICSVIIFAIKMYNDYFKKKD